MKTDEEREVLIHQMEQQADATFDKNAALMLRAWAILLRDMAEIKQDVGVSEEEATE